MLLCVCVMLLVSSKLRFCLGIASLDAQWEQWKITYGKHYDDHVEVEWYRRNIWKRNMQMIEVHNQEAEEGKHSYKLGMNHRGDMWNLASEEEFSYFKDQTKQEATQKSCKWCIDFNFMNSVKHNMTDSLPKSIDYREEGLVTQVKDQGFCLSCWAFSVVGALEGQVAKKTGQLLNLSTQNLVDCVPESNGCHGGFIDLSFQYVVQNGGLSSEEDYPYTEQKQTCLCKPTVRESWCKDFKSVQKGNEQALAKALNVVGPLSVGINIGTKFLFYKSGIYYNPECDEDKLNHAVLLVGYGKTAKGKKYWIVKNSYGESWGEEGYIRMARNRNNHCGIASKASYPLM